MVEHRRCSALHGARRLGIVGINNDGTVFSFIDDAGSLAQARPELGWYRLLTAQPSQKSMQELWVPAWSSRPMAPTWLQTTNGSAGPSSSHRIWSTADGRLAAEFGSTEDAGFPGGWWFEFTADGSKLVVGGGDGIVRVFDFDQLVSGVSVEEALITASRPTTTS